VAFGHVALRVGDLDRSRAFYGAIGFELGDSLPVRDGVSSVFLVLPDDHAEPRLQLVLGREAQDGPDHFAVRVPDLAATLKALADIGTHPSTAPREDAPICLVEDPDGHTVEIIGAR
jgi:lactoylglutathione lyase